jgi:MoaA/NifB/PqqE/SkfB family radical SAM enzyme
LQVDDAGLPGSIGDGAPLSTAQWQNAIAAMVARLGPLPVTVLAQNSGGLPIVAMLVRFAHRLECSTLLVTNGTGVDHSAAHALLSAGLGAVRVHVGGVSEAVQQATVGNSAADATGAVAVLLKARTEGQAPLDVEVAIPWVVGVDEELSAVVGWAKQAGVDGLRIAAPYQATSIPVLAELLNDTINDADGFFRNTSSSIRALHAMADKQDGAPGTPRGSGRRRCPVGGQRLVIGAQRAVYSCPFQAPMGSLDGEIDDVLSQGRPHLEAIKACTRSCVHPDLAPQPLLG